MLVSVVVVCYNHALYLEECLNSIYAQSYKNFELIFIDAGSTDKSMEKIKLLSCNIDMQIYERKGASLADNLNFGLSICKGEIFSPCAADDYWTFDKLAIQIALFKEKKNLFAISGNVIQVDENSIPLNANKQYFINKERSLNFKDFFTSQYYFPSIVCSYNLNKLRDVDGFPEGLGIEDFPLYLKSSLKNYEHLLIPSLLGFYRKSRYQYTSNQLKMVNEQTVILKQYSDHKLFSQARRNWGLDGAVRLATKHKVEAIKLIFNNFNLKIIFDKRLYKVIIKLIVK